MHTAVTCNDKIWAPSFAEVGFGTNNFAPVEGSKLDGFSDNESRKKNDAGWWLRTPYTYDFGYAWGVGSDGSQNYRRVGSTIYGGVVAAFEI